MKIAKIIIMCLVFLMTSLCFYACDSNLPDMSCQGTVTFKDVGLDGVTIKSNIKEYTKTTSRGDFVFSTKASVLEIYPEKPGYMFEPKSAKLTPGENTVTFVALEIENLTGTLRLNKIEITPTSIISSVNNNYEYQQNGKQCLKASDISICYDDQNYLLTTGDTYLYKSQINEISALNKFSIDCSQQFTIGIIINAYFKNYYNEAHTTDNDFATLKVTTPPTNKDLSIGNGQVVYTINSINNKSMAFTFGVSFIFDYIE